MEPPLQLLVLESPVEAEALRRQLDPPAFMTSVVHSLSDARAHLHRYVADVLILPVDCPNSGLPIPVLELRAEWPRLAMLVVTPHETQPDAVALLRDGADGFLVSPFQRRELHMLTRQLVVTRGALVAGLGVDALTEAQSQAQDALVERLLHASGHLVARSPAQLACLGRLAGILCQWLGWQEPDAQRMSLAAQLADVGKLALPPHLWHQARPLTEQEWSLIRQHPSLGAALLQDASDLTLQVAARVAAYHHERWDGAGYPDGLVGHRIPVEARVGALVEVTAAVTHARAYGKVWSEGELRAYLLEEQGRRFDPELVNVVMAHWEEWWEAASRTGTVLGERWPAPLSASGSSSH